MPYNTWQLQEPRAASGLLTLAVVVSGAGAAWPSDDPRRPRLAGGDASAMARSLVAATLQQ